ncbi:MAG: ATP-binding protein [Gemmatimonadota bacterium]|jgi:signal transduction histidine kinase
MKVQSRLLITLAGVVVLMAVPSAYGLKQLNRLRDIDLRGHHAEASLALGGLQAELADLDRFERSYIILPSDELRQAIDNSLEQLQRHLASLQEAGYSESARPTKALVDSLSDATARIVVLMEEGHDTQATNFFQNVKPLLERTRASLDGIADVIDRRSQENVQLAESLTRNAASTVTFTFIIGVVLTLLAAVTITRMLSAPLRKLSGATAAVADGNFVAPPDLPYGRNDEIGELSRSFGSMTERLAELDQLKAEFISLASHELKTPINVVGGYVELLEEGLYGEVNTRQREVLDLILGQTENLTRLVNQLLDLGRFESGGFQIHFQDLDLAVLMDRLQRTFQALADQKQIDFAIHIASPLPPLHADPDRLEHEVFGNLLSNAFKFTPPGGQVHVTAHMSDGHVEIAVEDTGEGIPPDELANIFEKYYQVGQDARSQGSGLGLAIARQIVRAHDGEIGVESEPGRGTRFWIRLPTTAEEA